MLRTKLSELFVVVISELIGEGRLPAEVLSIPIEIADPKNADHGDFACNFALVVSKAASQNPRVIGEMLAAKLLEKYGSVLTAVEVAGPGFINLRLEPSFVAGYVPTVLQEDFKLESASRTPNPLRINVEFVSVNPNGPITIGSGRGAAYGSTLCNVLEAVGHTIYREYYINDGVSSTQMALFAESVKAIVEGRPVPDNGYKGDYVYEVAEAVRTFFSPDADQRLVQIWTQDAMIGAQARALLAFGVEYDTWYSEQSLHDNGHVETEIAGMIEKGIADNSPIRAKLKLAKGFKIEDVLFESQTAAMETEDEHGQEPNLDDLVPTIMPLAAPSMEGSIADPDPLEAPNPDASPGEGKKEGETLWLRSTKLGDDMDRVVRRRDGRLTYIASDVAYHKDKFNRPPGADKLITILGPDHHGYIGRLTAVVAAMMMEKPIVGEPLEDPVQAKLYRDSGEKEACEKALAQARAKLEIQIYQLVRFLKDGKPAPMRKRDGNIYALIDLMREIGVKLKPEGSESDQLSAGKDVARFFYLMRSHDTTFDFDLDLAEKQSDENPVFYVQYAHARICSILAKSQQTAVGGQQSNSGLLTHDREKALIKKIVDLPDEVRRASEDYGVHRLATYAIELARSFHHFYDGCRVIQEDQPDLTNARLDLCRATRKALQTTLQLLGVSAPERM
ncbi:MAG: arginine--tRNA ligase [Armatimonadetes bacterium]|nr:arginine--tRNA ligase [Armatimonadota bacterium]